MCDNNAESDASAKRESSVHLVAADAMNADDWKLELQYMLLLQFIRVILRKLKSVSQMV